MYKYKLTIFLACFVVVSPMYAPYIDPDTGLMSYSDGEELCEAAQTVFSTSVLLFALNSAVFVPSKMVGLTRNMSFSTTAGVAVTGAVLSTLAIGYDIRQTRFNFSNERVAQISPWAFGAAALGTLGYNMYRFK